MLDITKFTYNKYLDGDCGILDAHCHVGLLPEPNLYAEAIDDFSVISCGTLPSRYENDNKLSNNYVIVGLGLHPREITEDNLDRELSKFQEALNHYQPQVIGEVGLDFSDNFVDTKELQIKAFNQICNKISQSENQILSIHAIKSADKVMDILEKTGATNSNKNIIIFHWFSDSCDALNRAKKFGAYFSVGPKMLATRRGYEYTRQIPENRLLVETDLPWDNEPLTPTEHYNILNDFLIELRDTKGY